MPDKRRQHKTELRARELKESYCVTRGCKFFGQRAVQGVCFAKLDGMTNGYIKSVLESGEHMLQEMRSLRRADKQTTDKKWIKYLEGHVVCSWANDTFGLDELIYLRAENAKLRNALAKAKASPSGSF
ncbi:hypothetical protein LCGC14_2602830 [marine sediment metagenome]|uniref:Uncharacterized protein n=1 Tax=marine sediment metagenome TaxID=412755 RepID=A0A0F9D105_9ZZZZ